MSPALAGGFLTTAPPGKPFISFLKGPFVMPFRAATKFSPHCKVFPVKGNGLLSQLPSYCLKGPKTLFIACFVIIEINPVNINTSPFPALMILSFVSEEHWRDTRGRIEFSTCVVWCAPLGRLLQHVWLLHLSVPAVPSGQQCVAPPMNRQLCRQHP